MRKFITIFAAVLMLFAQPAFAEVITTEKTEGYAEYIYVAGAPDNYPLEYYDSETESYRGVIPDILGIISERTGLGFVYINGGGEDRNLMGKNLQVDIVSAVSANESREYAKEYLKLLAYERDGEIREYGFAFTNHSDAEMIEAIKSALEKLSPAEKNGIYLSYAVQKNKAHGGWLIATITLSFLLLIFGALMLIRIRKIRKENDRDRMTDTETNLGNLRFFHYHFRYTIGDIARNLYDVAYIILDGKYLRSYYGEDTYKDALQYTSSVLSEYTGDREISARVAENEFAIAFRSLNDEDAKRRIREIMERLDEFESNKPLFYAACYRLAPNDRNCELLLFNLKKSCESLFGGEERLVFCDARAMNVIAEEKKITENILKGFRNNEFKMYLQFVVDNKTKEIAACEALSRWDSHEKGLLNPSEYIKSIEDAGLISKLDFHMFERACRQLEKWSGTEYENISISCNFTRITLSEEDFIDRIIGISEKFSFEKARLSIEITEDAMEKNREIAIRNMKRCKELGFRIYLDDLGSGCTSLANLCDFPIDIVKVDRDILKKADTQRGKELVLGVIALAHSLNIEVICEGVETKEQNEFISNSDCDYIQGWYYSKPIPLRECENFINGYSSKLHSESNE